MAVGGLAVVKSGLYKVNSNLECVVVKKGTGWSVEIDGARCM